MNNELKKGSIFLLILLIGLISILSVNATILHIAGTGVLGIGIHDVSGFTTVLPSAEAIGRGNLTNIT